MVKMENEEVKMLSAEYVRLHSTEDDAWVIHEGSVYDVTKFLSKHPGGKEIVLQHAGQDVTALMANDDFHQHSISAYSLLETYKIGKLKEAPSKRRNGFKMTGWKEEMVNWDKGMVRQVHKFGPDYKKWVHSPVDKNLRLFDSGFVEFFSKTPWYVVPLIWIPVVIIMTFISIQNLKYYSIPGFEKLTVITPYILASVMFLSGLLLWSFIEYMLHRYLFHLDPPDDSWFWITFHFFLHGQHHKVPFDSERLVFPPVAASVFAILFYVLLTSLMPVGFAQGLFAGGVFGYVCYDMIHYYLHHGRPSKGTYLERLKQYHVAHHFVDQNKGFGISSMLWDFPFGTYPKKHD